MRPHRRQFLKTMSVAPLVSGPAAGEALSGYQPGNSYDVAVIGAGVFGSWTAHHLLKAGKKVLLIDQYGASNSRASSGGESRIIRMGYGADEIYTRSSQRALELWKEFFQRTGNPFFHQAGVLWLARGNDSRIPTTVETLARAGVKFEKLSRSELEKRFPQINFNGVEAGVYEPESGALLARRAVQAVVKDFIDQGGHFLPEPIAAPSASSGKASISARPEERINAGSFVFACGPWLPKVFPDLLGKRIFPTRQDVFFFAVPPGDRRWTPPAMPAWIDVDVELYGIPDLENRGFKIANDHHGSPFDPDSPDRFVTKEQIVAMRRRLGQLFPGLKDAPLVESRVCQYENSSNGDFLVDVHPEMKNVWLVGGGSGHGFKHGPALGEYVAAQVLGTGRSPEPRYSLQSKNTIQKRSVI
jgi:sarcosine oxidase